ncbi:fish-egg lectin-like [Coregonus clupeaformis]|uniref:fish-egg lectin-like n=1 Tax=Coregonus clupeaformis TaxID=59861 RepID=UPI001E1C4B1A|nr:fish-egg lectin-like [Coregonus clupeaformis]
MRATAAVLLVLCLLALSHGVLYSYVIDGKLSMIEVATDGSVFGVNSLGDVYTRDGITASKPEGNGRSNIPMGMRMGHVTYDLGCLWVVSKSGFTMVCTR